MDADSIIQLLGLAPHPEGGWYRQTWRDETGSAIYFLLCDGEASTWHRVRGRTELWHYYAGAPLELDVDREGKGEQVSTVRLGIELDDGERPQAVVPADSWQRARSMGAWTLVGCTVSTPFTFDAFELR